MEITIKGKIENPKNLEELNQLTTSKKIIYQAIWQGKLEDGEQLEFYCKRTSKWKDKTNNKNGCGYGVLYRIKEVPKHTTATSLLNLYYRCPYCDSDIEQYAKFDTIKFNKHLDSVGCDYPVECPICFDSFIITHIDNNNISKIIIE